MRAAGSLVLAILMAGSLSAQIDRTQPPAPGEARPFKLPPVFETKLPNGLSILLIDDARIPLATVRLAFACGNRRDPNKIPGLSAAVAEMLTQGTKNRSFNQIAGALDGLGGVLTGSSSADFLSLNGSIDARNLPAMIEVMADVAMNASFPNIDLLLYTQNRKQTLARQHSQPSFVANEVFRRTLFGTQPYAHITTTPDAIDAMDHKALQDFHDTWMVPNNAVLIAIGRLPARAEMMKMLTDRFGGWEQKPLPETKPAAAVAPAKRMLLVDMPGDPQVDIRIGRTGATQREPGYFAEVVASLIVGGIPNGRLMRDLREKRGFAYDVRTEHVAFDEAGIVSVVTQVKPEAAGEALQAILDHLRRMADEPVTAKELADAKTQLEGSFMFRLEPQAGLADELVVDRIQRLPANYVENWRAALDAVTVADVQSAAKKYLAPQDSVVVVVGDASKIGGAMAKAGKFEVLK